MVSLGPVILALALAADAPCPDVPDLGLLQALRQRRAEQDGREATLTAQAAALEARRKHLGDRITALEAEVARIEAALDLGDAAQQARDVRLKALLATLDNLTARKAAPVLAATDPDLVAELLLRMDPARSAALLALIPAPQAGKLLDEVGTRRRRRAAAAATPNREADPAARSAP